MAEQKNQEETQEAQPTASSPGEELVLDMALYRELAQAHLDALAHAAIRGVGLAAGGVLGEAGDVEEAQPFYEAAAQVEAVANHFGVLLPLQELAARYGLDPVELDALVWAFVQQSRSEEGALPTLGEFLTVRFDSSGERNKAMTLFRPEARLRHWGLLRLVVRADALIDNLNQRVLSLPEPITAFLMGERSLGEQLNAVAQMVNLSASQPEEMRGLGPRRTLLPAEIELKALVQNYIDGLMNYRERGENAQSLVVEIASRPRSGSSSAVHEMARSFGALLIEVDGSRLAMSIPQAQLQIIDELAAAVQLYDAWLVIDRIEALGLSTLDLLAKLTSRVMTVIYVISQNQLPASHPLGALALRHFDLEAPEITRQYLWKQQLEEAQVTLPSAEDLHMIAAKFDLNAGQIQNAARLVSLRSAPADQAPPFDALDASAFEQQRGRLGEVAQFRKGRGNIDDLILPESEKEGIREIIRAANYRSHLLHSWRFKERFNYGTGIVALFSGEPGTGKTFAAEVIAGSLGLDLYQIAAQQVVSKWVGETEKQIERIFEEAKVSRAVLLFDEADSFLGSRTEVKTASDRYANMATNQLLQAIEAYEGIVLLTTNLEENLDAAAERRILFKIRFPFPEKEERAALWQMMLPKGAPLGDDIDYEELGELFELSGGHIKNAIIRAGYDAIERGTPLNMDTLMTAAERESTMTGRLVRRGEFFR